MDKSITQATQNDKQISKSIKRFFTRFMFAQLCIRYALQLGIPNVFTSFFLTGSHKSPILYLSNKYAYYDKYAW